LVRCPEREQELEQASGAGAVPPLGLSSFDRPQASEKGHPFGTTRHRELHGTIEVVAEANQGGKMVKAVLHAADPRLRVKLVNAHTGKSARAEPVSHLFEAGRAWLHGRMPELEAQMLGIIAGGGYKGPGQSPDRADAMVWGVSELMRERAEPRVRVL